MEQQPAIEARGLRKAFGATVAVAGLDLVVQEGEIFGVVGPDGAGKTTTFRLLLGLLTPDAGSVRVAGFEVPRHAREAREVTGYVAQAFALYGDLSVWENLQFAAEVRGMDSRAYQERAESLLRLTEMERFKERLARDLSGGMKRKLALACALLPRPRVVILDEPTTGVDPVSRREFWRLLYRLPAEGVTLVVSTPYLDEAERCHRLAFMGDGRLLATDTPTGLLGQMAYGVVEIRLRPEEVLVVTDAAGALRWHRLGFRPLRSGPPLTAPLEIAADHRLEVAASAPVVAWQVLTDRERFPEVRWVDWVGGALRVAVDLDAPGIDGGRALGRRMAEAGLPVEACEPVAATLPDVFTTLSENPEAAS